MAPAKKKKSTPKKKKAKAPAKKAKASKSKKKAPTKARASKRPAAKPKGKAKAPVKKAKGKAAKKSAASKGSKRRPVAKQKEVTPPKPARRRVTGKILPREFLHELAQAVRKAVRPAITAGKGRDVVGKAPSGDATFELDKIAEKALLNFLKRKRLPVAYYSEDSGYTTFSSGQPQNLLVVDPIDGTRAARMGFEGCTVSVCSTRMIERPTFGDVDNGLVMEIVGNRTFYAERDNGARMYQDGHTRKIKLSDNVNLESLAWSMTVPARPAELIFPVAARIIDLSSLKGGFFSCNSTSYSLTRLVSGQLDACVDFANRFYRDMPKKVEDQFINAGRGEVLGVCPYDFAAAMLIAQEAGCTVTDAFGNGFDEVLLLDSTSANHGTVIAAANANLHEKLFNYFDQRIKQYEGLLSKRG